MKVDVLTPAPTSCEPFRRNRERFIPMVPGCYVLTTVDKTVLYLGLTKNLRQRLNQHLDDPRKIAPTVHGRAVLFFWLETVNLNLVERTWQNIHISHEGCLPVLSTVFSPVST
jgi:hypothetical protein